MQPKTLLTTVLGGLALLTTTTHAVSTVLVKNYLAREIYLTIYSNGTTTGPFTLQSNQAYLSDIIGQGDTATVSNNSDIYSPKTAKMILGSSTSGGILYWSINDDNGNPLAGSPWSVTSGGTAKNICGNTNQYGSSVYSCQDDKVTLTLNLG